MCIDMSLPSRDVESTLMLQTPVNPNQLSSCCSCLGRSPGMTTQSSGQANLPCQSSKWHNHKRKPWGNSPRVYPCVPLVQLRVVSRSHGDPPGRISYTEDRPRDITEELQGSAALTLLPSSATSVSWELEHRIFEAMEFADNTEARKAAASTEEEGNPCSNIRDTRGSI